MKRILIIKLWALGDILMMTPLLTALASQWPEAEITWVADTQYAEILEDHPRLHELIAVDTGRWRRLLRQGKLMAWLAEARRLHGEMRRRQFDVVINFHPEKWWMRLLAVAPVRVALFASQQPTVLKHLYTHTLSKPGTLHNTDYCLAALPALGADGPFDRHMAFEVSPRAEEEASAFLSASDGYDPALPLLALHPGTSQEPKSWLPEHFAAVAALLAPRFNIVITGSPKEAALAEAICGLLPAGTRQPLIAAGRVISLGASAALIGQAAAVVTGDTFALHLASALGTPLVGIYGGSRPGDNAPLFGPNVLLFDDAVPCAPCYKERCPLRGNEHLRCQRAVTPNQVIEALETLWKED